MGKTNSGFYAAKKEKRLKSHLPVAILIDKSGSTADIHDLMENCARNLLKRLQDELTFRGIVEVLIVFFSETYQEADFTPLEEIDPAALSVPKSEGTTHTGQALLYALERLTEKKTVWKQAGEDYFQPLMFLLTDGYPTAGELQNPERASAELRKAHEEAQRAVEEAYAEAAAAIQGLEGKERLLFIAAGVQRRDGESADMDSLRKLSAGDDHVFPVSDGDGMDGVQRFFNQIYTMTKLVYKRTPMSEILEESLDYPV